MPAVIEPSDETVSENDFSTPAARRTRSPHDGLGAAWKSARRTSAPMRGPNGSFLPISAGTVTQPLCSAAVLERPEQHGLADAAQAGDQHRLLGVAVPQPLEQDLEALELGVAADEHGRACAARSGCRDWRAGSPDGELTKLID